MQTTQLPQEVWASGAAYEPYVGRWSRLVAGEFLFWLAVPPGAQWLDVGCGTGALSQTVLQQASPQTVHGIDRAAGYIEYARFQTQDERIRFEVGDAQALPVASATFDVAVSGLMINFLPQPDQAIAEMQRTVRPGGIVGAYVWDYAGEMQLMRHFWNAAVALDPEAHALDEGVRFPLCQPGPLKNLFQQAGLQNVTVRAIDIATEFINFDDYWSPFLGGQGPAPGYAMSLNEVRRAALRERIRANLPVAPDGSISLVARAWAVQGTNVGS